MTTTTERTGTIFLKNTLDQGQHYSVRDTGSGPEYYLGEPARTSDGWVVVPKEHLDKISWA